MMKRVRDIGQIIRPDFITNILEALCRGTGLGHGTLTQQQHKAFRKTTLPKLATDHYKYLIGQLGLKTKPLNVEMRLKQLFPAHCIKTLEHLDYNPNADADEFLRSMHNNLFIKTTLNDRTTFTFKDYLLGDYCAGFTLATDLKNGSNLNLEALLNSRQFIIQHRFNYYYQPLLWFTAGHLKDSNTLHYYLDLITKPEYTHYDSTRSKFTINLLLRCLEEAQLEKHHLEPQHQRIIATLEGDFCKYAKTDPEAFAVIEATPTTYWRALWLHTQGHRNSYSFTDFETRILAPVSLAYPEILLPYIEKQVLESPSESLSQVYKDLIHLDIAPPPTEKIIQKINTKPTVSLTEILSTIGLYYPDQVMLKLRQLSAQEPKVRLNTDQQSCSLFNSHIDERKETHIRISAFNGYCAIAKKHNLPNVAEDLIKQLEQSSYNKSLLDKINAQIKNGSTISEKEASMNHQKDIYNQVSQLDTENILEHNNIEVLITFIQLTSKTAILNIDSEPSKAIELLRKIRMHKDPCVSATALLAIRDIVGHRDNPGLLSMIGVDHAIPERSAAIFTTALSKVIENFHSNPSDNMPMDHTRLECFDRFLELNPVDIFDYLYYQIHHNATLNADDRIMHLQLLARFTEREEKHKAYHIFKDILTHGDDNIVHAAAKILIDNYPLELATRCWFELKNPSWKFTHALKQAYDQQQAVLSYDDDQIILHYDGNEIDIGKVTHPRSYTYFLIPPSQFLYPVEPIQVISLSNDILHDRYIKFMDTHSSQPTQNITATKEIATNNQLTFNDWIEQDAPNYCDSIAQLLIEYECYLDTITQRPTI